MHWAISEIRASPPLGDITSPKPSPCTAETSLWVGVLCFLELALEVCFVNSVFRTAVAAACASYTLAFCLISHLYFRKPEW